MKTRPLCLLCVFIFALSRFLVLGEDVGPPVAPAFAPSENVSAEAEPEGLPPPESGDHEVHELEPSAEIVGSFNEKIEEGDAFKQVFAEATSQNSGIANEITTGGPPVVVTLTDVATAELHQKAILPSQDEEKPTSQQNQTSKIEDFKESNRSEPEPADKLDVPSAKENLTEEIPSFSEWAQKQLEEAEKNKEPSNASTQHQNVNGKQTKLRWKNYASLDCGAKVVASNPEAVSPSAILSPSRDEYKLNPCTSRIWFVVELCEAIQAKKIDFANFELFSSSPKDFVVSVSDRFPTREWSPVGQFTAKDERDIQSFDLHPHLFAKFIKVEVKSHYGSEHYCPISLFRVFGTSEFEVLEKEDPGHANRLEEDEDDDDDALVGDGDSSKNLFSSATDAVISMVKKAAEVLGNKGNHSNQTEVTNNTKQAVPLVRLCTCLRHNVVCDNCSDALFGQVYELLSCEDVKVRGVTLAFRKILTETNICGPFGLQLGQTESVKSRFVKALFREPLIGAMCNMAGVMDSKVVLNMSSHYSNDTQATDDEKIVNIETSEPHVLQVETAEPEVTESLTLATSEAVTKSSCSTDVTYTSQIKPTKTLTPDVDLESSTEEALKSVATPPEPVQTNQSDVAAPEPPEDKGDVEAVTESVEGLDDFLELNGEGQLPTAQTTSSTPQAQKESVFLRLSNRIKALERNMSLSGQYLEELSKRYKKQVEEIQKLLDKTILSMTEESKKKDERNKQLEERLLALTANVEALIAERRNWSSTISCIVVSSLVTLFIVTFCCKIPDPIAPKRCEPDRRKSIDVVRSPPQKKKRRPSDQALKIVRSSMETNESRKKKKKKQLLKRSNSISTLGEEKAAPWSRQESTPPESPVDWVEGKRIEEVPFVLEESEHSSLEPLALAEGGRLPATPTLFKTALSSRAGRANGDVRKSASVDETSRKANGSANSGDGAAPKEKRRGLKKIFRRVF